MLIREGGKQQFSWVKVSSQFFGSLQLTLLKMINYVVICLQPINRRRVGSPSKGHSSTIRVELNTSDESSTISLDNELSSLELDLGAEPLGPSIDSPDLEKLISDDLYCVNFSPRSLDLRHRIHLDRRSWLEVKDPLHR